MLDYVQNILNISLLYTFVEIGLLYSLITFSYFLTFLSVKNKLNLRYSEFFYVLKHNKKQEIMDFPLKVKGTFVYLFTILSSLFLINTFTYIDDNMFNINKIVFILIFVLMSIIKTILLRNIIEDTFVTLYDNNIFKKHRYTLYIGYVCSYLFNFLIVWVFLLYLNH